MKLANILPSLVVLCLILGLCRPDDGEAAHEDTAAAPASKVSENEITGKNATNSSEPAKGGIEKDTESNKPHDDTDTAGGSKSFKDVFANNSDMLKRAMYVTIAITGILLLYFGIRFMRSRKRRVKRYGPLLNPGDNVEMAPLASDSDEDMTVFDARRNLVQ